MNLLCRFESLLIFFWIQSGFVPGIRCNNALIINHLSRQDVQLLKNEQDPKCFSRTQKDLTCFIETADNRTYDFLYSTPEQQQKKRCEVSVRRTEEGKFFHVCSFPDSDVFLFVDTHIEVVENATNKTIHRRAVCVEDQVLLDPPFNVSLNPNDQAGQLRVSWHAQHLQDQENSVKIQYSSRSLGEKTRMTKSSTDDVLDSLVSGEEIEVRVSVKTASNPDGGHWSSWSHPVRAVVPQTADDILLTCYTSDLHNVTCHWDGRRYIDTEYRLFYKMEHRKTLNWTEWTECGVDKNLTDWCWFHGDPAGKVKVKLNSTSATSSRTFYTKEFTQITSIKTPPPGRLGLLKNGELCLKWEAPLPSLSIYLQYEVDYQIKGSGEWKVIKGSKTHACLDVQAGRQYSMKVRARPNGTIYSGFWSDWSDELTGGTPTNTGLWLMLCIPIALLIITVLSISLFFSTLKQYFWPPVPNLDKFLQGFLTDVSSQKWDPSVTTKQCCEETTSCLVEVMSEEEGSGLLKPSEDSSEGSLSSSVQVDRSPVVDVFPDYVTLNEDSSLYLEGNSYVCEQVREKKYSAIGDELLQACESSSDGSVCASPCMSNDFLNHSYFPLVGTTVKCNNAVTAARGPGNLYTNLPHS
ncbi:thrombopoietin receptor [Parambassis ranga]|uniref:Thrombopoietin receptor n=1 Tax=Parambassis ranga TaxID=210632 RepID=A0A6P7HTC3_9TELE|nr:thrombopoietin receptor [Parambassis ranga]